MNPLPQRKKTAEEIAALRESLAPIGQPPAIAQAAAPAPPPPPPVERPPAAPRPPVEAKPVTSLRKSEHGPSTRSKPAPVSSANSPLPLHRRDDHELNQIRRAQAFEVQKPGAFLIALTAHPAILTAGYACVIVAAALPFVDWLWAAVSYYIPAVLDVAGLVIAAFIFLKKKRSLHHAGFIAVIAVFTIIFGALYYFPHLRNAP
jgi:hypothetical protein